MVGNKNQWWAIKIKKLIIVGYANKKSMVGNKNKKTWPQPPGFSIQLRTCSRLDSIAVSVFDPIVGAIMIEKYPLFEDN